MAAKAVIPAFTCEFACWDGTNVEEIRAIAGDRLKGTFDAAVLVESNSGELVHVRPGWYVSKRHDSPGILISNVEAWLWHRPDIKAE
jgi:hypothetical protein